MFTFFSKELGVYYDTNFNGSDTPVFLVSLKKKNIVSSWEWHKDSICYIFTSKYELLGEDKKKWWIENAKRILLYFLTTRRYDVTHVLGETIEFKPRENIYTYLSEKQQEELFKLKIKFEEGGF